MDTSAVLHTDDFPQYADGDVEIILSASRCYKLHKSILCRASRTFATLLREEGVTLSKKARDAGITTRYRLVLNISGSTWMFTRDELNANGKSVARLVVPYENANGRSVWLGYNYLDAFFRAVYNKPMNLNHRDDSSVLHDLLGTLDCAEMLKGIQVVSKPIEAALLSQGQKVFLLVSQDPCGWASLSKRLQSRSIFREAIIHAVGRYHEMKRTTDEGRFTTLDSLDHSIRDLIDKKYDALIKATKEVQSRIAAYYPAELRRTAVTGRVDRDPIGRKDYSNDIFTWMALSLFRHWYTLAIIHGKTHDATDMGYSIYKNIAEGGHAYLDRNMTSQFHTLFPMSSKAQAVVHTKLDGVKEDMKIFVEPVLKVCCHLDVVRYDVKWFTCVEVHEDEFPFDMDEDEDVAVGGQDDKVNKGLNGGDQLSEAEDDDANMTETVVDDDGYEYEEGEILE